MKSHAIDRQRELREFDPLSPGGDPAACIDQRLAVRGALARCALLLTPAAYDPAARRRALTLFAERVRPDLLSGSARWSRRA